MGDRSLLLGLSADLVTPKKKKSSIQGDGLCALAGLNEILMGMQQFSCPLSYTLIVLLQENCGRESTICCTCRNFPLISFT